MRASWILGIFLVFFISYAQSADLLGDARSAIRDRHFVEAESLLKSILKSNPKQDEARFWLAKVLAWQGHYAESSGEYQKLLEKEPGNTDYMLGQAQVLVWSENSKEALPILDSAQRLNPSDPDILRLYIQALAAIGEVSTGNEAFRLQQEAKQLFPMQIWDIVTVDAEASGKSSEQTFPRVLDALDRDFTKEHNDQVGVGYAYDHLSQGKGNWHASYFEFEHRYAPRKVVYGTVQETERFGHNDLQFLIGGYYPLPSGVTLNIEGNVSATHNILPMNGEMVSLQLPIATGWFVTGGLRSNEYTSSRSYQEFGLLEWYFSDYRAAYTLTSTQAQGSTVFGNSFSLSRYYNDISFVTLSLGQGSEVEGGQGGVFFSTPRLSA